MAFFWVTGTASVYELSPSLLGEEKDDDGGLANQTGEIPGHHPKEMMATSILDADIHLL